MINGRWFMGMERIEDIRALREEVFAGELGEAKEALVDGYDEYAMHVIMFDDERPVGCGRIYRGNEGFMLGRICVKREARGQYIGDLMTRLMIWKASGFAPALYIEAPLAVKGYFARYGFAEYGEAQEDGAQCVKMKVAKENVRFPSKCGEDCAKHMIEEEK